MSYSYGTSDEIREYIQQVSVRGRRWLILFTLIPLVVLAIQLFAMVPATRHATHHTHTTPAMLAGLVLAAILQTILGVIYFPLMMKSILRRSITGKHPIPSEFETPNAFSVYFYIGVMAGPSYIWAVFGMICYLITQSMWASLLFYAAGFAYLIWLWLSMNTRFARLTEKLCTYAEELRHSEPNEAKP